MASNKPKLDRDAVDSMFDELPVSTENPWDTDTAFEAMTPSAEEPWVEAKKQQSQSDYIKAQMPQPSTPFSLKKTIKAVKDVTPKLEEFWSAFAPYTTESQSQGQGPLSQLWAAGADVASAPFRFLGEGITQTNKAMRGPQTPDNNQGLLYGMNDIYTDKGFGQNLIRDPQFGATVLTSPLTGGTTMIPKMIQSGAQGVGAGIIGEGGYHATEGKEYSPVEGAARTGISGVLGGAAPLVSLLKVPIKKAVSMFTGKSPESLNAVSTYKGLKQMQDAYNGEYKVADKVTTHLDKDVYSAPFESKITTTLDKSKPIPTAPAIADIDNQLTKLDNTLFKTPAEKEAAMLPLKNIKEYLTTADEFTGNETRDIQRRVWRFLKDSPKDEPQTKALETVLDGMRNRMRETVGTKEFTKLETGHHEMTKVADRLKTLIGKTPTAQEQFIKDVARNPHSEGALLLKEFDRLTGNQFLDEAKNTKIASDILNPDKKVPFSSEKAGKIGEWTGGALGGYAGHAVSKATGADKYLPYYIPEVVGAGIGSRILKPVFSSAGGPQIPTAIARGFNASPEWLKAQSPGLLRSLLTNQINNYQLEGNQ